MVDAKNSGIGKIFIYREQVDKTLQKIQFRDNRNVFLWEKKFLM